jgi:hypothetical protein
MNTSIYSAQAPAPIGPYSQAIQAGNTLYVSGQIAIDPQTGALNTFLKISTISPLSMPFMALSSAQTHLQGKQSK